MRSSIFPRRAIGLVFRISIEQWMSQYRIQVFIRCCGGTGFARGIGLGSVRGEPGLRRRMLLVELATKGRRENF